MSHFKAQHLKILPWFFIDFSEINWNGFQIEVLQFYTYWCLSRQNWKCTTPLCRIHLPAEATFLCTTTRSLGKDENSNWFNLALNKHGNSILGYNLLILLLLLGLSLGTSSKTPLASFYIESDVLGYETISSNFSYVLLQMPLKG